MYQRIESVKGQTYAVTMAGFLATISTISFAFIFANIGGKEASPEQVNEINELVLLFSIIGFLSVWGVALLSDFVLDEAKIDMFERFHIFNFGYLAFSTLISFLMFGVVFVFFKHCGFIKLNEHIYTFISILVGCSVWLKIMSRNYFLALFWMPVCAATFWPFLFNT